MQVEYLKKNTSQELSHNYLDPQEYDNPLRIALGSKFLETNFVASNHQLLEVEINSYPILRSLDSILAKEGFSQTLYEAEKPQQNDMFESVSVWRKIETVQYFQKKFDNFDNHYEMFDKLGEGTFGKVFIAVQRYTKDLRAVKVVRKNILNEQSEINILKQCDHPNIVRLFEVYEHQRCVYLILQYCKGGSIGKVLMNNDQNNILPSIMSEKFVSNIMRQLLHALAYLHKNSIVHGDVKLENMVFVEDDWKDIENPTIRLVDFGFAKKIKYKLMKEKGPLCGTIQYMPPEAFDGWISEKIDIWSCGVVFYILLSGNFPFYKKKKKDMKNLIMNTKLSFDGEEWANVSNQAKFLISNMLQKDFRRRPSAEQCLNNQWMQCTLQRRQKVRKLSSKIFKKLTKYQVHNNFVAVIQSYLSFLKGNTIQQEAQLKQLFNFLDHNKTGKLTAENIMKSMKQFSGEMFTKQYIYQVLKRIDKNKSGVIDYSQFKLALHDRKILFMKQSLEQAFLHFDRDKSGFIEKSEFMEIMKECKGKQIDRIMQQIDKNSDGKIDLKQFLEYFECHKQ